MRFWEDPLNQERLCDMLRIGMSTTDACKALGHGANHEALKKERLISVTFDEKVQLAQASAFTPVLQRALAIAEHGDPDDPATMKAMDLVFRHYNKALDRSHDHEKIEHLASKQHEMLTRQGVPGIRKPGDIKEIIDVYEEQKREEVSKEGGDAALGPGEAGDQ